MRVSLGDISARLSGELFGDPDLQVLRIGSLESADAQTISFLDIATAAHR